MDLPFYREYELPWTAEYSQEQRFRRLLGGIMVVALALSIIWPFLPSSRPDPNEAIEVPERLAKIMLEERIEPPPPPPPEPEPEEEEPEPEEPDPIEEPEPEMVAEEPPPEPEPVPEPEPDRTEVAREQAQAALMPFADDLASLVDQDLVETMADERELTSNVGRSERNERSMITSSVGTSSGGINTANMSRNTGGTQIASRTTTKVDSDVAAIAQRQEAGGARRTGERNKGSRSREEIELVFDKNKGAIFALYNRALRRDPSLEGKLVLRLTIAPSGQVTFCEVVSSELGDPELEQKLVQRVMLFRFEARDSVEPITTTKPIDFFPA